MIVRIMSCPFDLSLSAIFRRRNPLALPPCRRLLAFEFSLLLGMEFALNALKFSPMSSVDF
ncbi:hypothetical protein [Herbaspirillum robiniae]|uniref:Uncharacterized protein n=1 Tax=Herbaspirillum robiniae TaxID=2014887 RepID=A0ABX2LSV2_9BURK|nr:hypothetical protein [Herbaspirillum robiniae]NUU01625.1 hypothetical protein [Herbaspirillum robiniae]